MATTTCEERLSHPVGCEGCQIIDLLDRLARVEALCKKWDSYTKGESPTTAAIRGAVRGDGAGT